MQRRDLLIPPDEIAAAIHFLAAPESRSITGQALVVDRGALLLH
jgi:NAD(P)-dependent dehydrogenase (short-subunit alcohol dehydrogenase family)